MVFMGDTGGTFTVRAGSPIGITNAREYFDFARNIAFLDVISHQANDFQVNNAFWAHLNELTAKHNQDGRFVTFPDMNGRETPLSGAIEMFIFERRGGKFDGLLMRCCQISLTFTRMPMMHGNCSQR